MSDGCCFLQGEVEHSYWDMFSKYAQKFEMDGLHSHHVRVARMDYDRFTIDHPKAPTKENLPKFFFYPAKDKSNPVEYLGELAVSALSKFTIKNSQGFDADAAAAPKEPSAEMPPLPPMDLDALADIGGHNEL